MAVQARHVDTWVSEGIISQDQAKSICDYERMVTPSRGTAVEILGYFGASTAVGAAIILVSDIWGDLGWGSRVTILTVTAVALLIIGAISAGEQQSWVRRFGLVLMMLAVPLTASAAGAAASRWISQDPSVLVGFAIAWVVALILYLRWRSPAQQTALFFATIGAMMSLFMNLVGDGPDAIPGGIVLVVGLTWLIMSVSGVIVPLVTGQILGSIASLAGSVMLAGALTPDAGYALAAFVCLSGLGVAWGVRSAQTPLIAMGMVGLVVFIPWFVADVFDPTFAAPLTMLAVGLTLTIIAIVKARGTQRGSRPGGS
jgi:hypothetical protein